MPLQTHQSINFMLFSFLTKSVRTLPWSSQNKPNKSLYLLLYHTSSFAIYPNRHTITQLVDGFREAANHSLHRHRILDWYRQIIQFCGELNSRWDELNAVFRKSFLNVWKTQNKNAAIHFVPPIIIRSIVVES